MVEVARGIRCPACDTPLSQSQGIEGLCPSCLLELAMDDTSVEAEVLFVPAEAPTLQYSEGFFEEGQIQGERYRVRSLLGRGGMGEVWRAYDLKLRQEVALKALRSELIENRDALETLRQEVRAARVVISPNVCRVFDLQEIDGQELVAMEYVDGTTLQEILREEGPLELDRAREIASQFLAGLESIHDAGLVHRDIKPENVMVTRTGRVVVMDFGIAKGLGDGKGALIAGTPAYMSPEQSHGDELDARSDVFSAGVVLAEMVEPGGVHSFEDRQRLWEGVHREPPEVSETPWSRVIRQAVATAPDERYEAASALARALEEVTLRAVGDETARPYPGLAAFQQEDARFFFGRELEVEALWKKLRRPHLLALIGPSGAGKSSFLRAGLLPTLTDGWQAIVTTPGTHPFGHLARALAGELGEAPGVTDLPQQIDEPDIAIELLSEWRRQSKHALLIVDQFEELFTQNPEGVQASFAELLSRLALEADLFVLLSMRDDFVMHCHRFESLQPIFSELTPLDPPLGSALRRALVEPALKCGYRFEEESIVEEMLAEVEGERGALPMVAFTAATLWEERHRETGFLTRKAYEQIGGVGGALAQHAETTLKQIDEERIPVARELFRNLVTAQGTRAARDREELLSIFAEKGGQAPFSEEDDGASEEIGKEVPVTAFSTDEVLDTLIDARLLTSYEVPADSEGAEPHHRIEIVHESLLKAWPRLVRWQMQDAEGAQLRDDLRQQAQLWEQHGRSPDYLWTGMAFREYELWRERYPGGLTTAEEEFARAMTVHAERRKRRQRIAVAATFVLLVAVLAIVAGFWRRSISEARRAEAAKLLAVAELSLEDDPTEALAYTTASLELADTDEARVFSVKALSEAPPALILDGLGQHGRNPNFSSDGRWLATSGHAEEVLVWSQDGGGPVRLGGHKVSPLGTVGALWFRDRYLVTGQRTEERVRIWSFPGGKLVREIDFGAEAWWQVGTDHLFADVVETDAATGHEIKHLRSWRLPNGEARELGQVDWTALGGSDCVFDPDGDGCVYFKGNGVFYRPLPIRDGTRDRLVGAHENQAGYVARPTEPDRLWTRDRSTGELRLWSLSASKPEPLRVIPRPADAWERTFLRPDLGGRRVLGIEMTASGLKGSSEGLKVWDLETLPGSRGLKLRRRATWYAPFERFHPESKWVVASVEKWDQVVFWPLPERAPSVIDGYNEIWRPMAFSKDSRWLATAGPEGTLRLWPLQGGPEKSVRVLTVELVEGKRVNSLAFDAAGERVGGASLGPNLYVAPLNGGPIQKLEGFSRDHLIMHPLAFSPSGDLVAAGTSFGTGIEKVLRVWNLVTGEIRVFDLEETRIERVGDLDNSNPWPGYEGGIRSLAFTDESTLYSAGHEGVLRWDLEDGTWERIVPIEWGQYASLWLSDDRQQLITRALPHRAQCSPGMRPRLVLHDLSTDSTRNLATTLECTDRDLALNGSLSVYVAGRSDGTLRVGRVDRGMPHLLAGHQGAIDSVAISPDLQWIASTGEDNTLRLWPMPDLDQPPLHTLPHEELLAKLRSLTNLRAVEDPESPTGWKIDIGPFPGWQEVPTW